jgi:hypothetical protein
VEGRCKARPRWKGRKRIKKVEAGLVEWLSGRVAKCEALSSNPVPSPKKYTHTHTHTHTKVEADSLALKGEGRVCGGIGIGILSQKSQARRAECQSAEMLRNYFKLTVEIPNVPLGSFQILLRAWYKVHSFFLFSCLSKPVTLESGISWSTV